MQRINALDPETVSGKTKELFNAIQGKLGMVPNMMRTMGNSPAALNGYLSFSGALGESAIGPKLGELIALTVANANSCDYCNATHTYIGGNLLKIDSDSIDLAKEGKSKDPQTEAALAFSRTLIAKKGNVSAQDIDSLKKAGFTEGMITEIIAHTGLNIFTNYFNNAVGIALDFPEAALIEAVAI